MLAAATDILADSARTAHPTGDPLEQGAAVNKRPTADRADRGTTHKTVRRLSPGMRPMASESAPRAISTMAWPPLWPGRAERMQGPDLGQATAADRAGRGVCPVRSELAPPDRGSEAGLAARASPGRCGARCWRTGRACSMIAPLVNSRANAGHLLAVTEQDSSSSDDAPSLSSRERID